MRKRTILGICLIIMALSLTGCSLSAYKPSVSKVEAVAQECINRNIKSNSKTIEKGKGATGVYYIYQMVDNRGIEFTVKLYTDYVSIVEPIPPFLSDYRRFYTNYDDKVIEHYEGELQSLLDKECVVKYTANGGIDVFFEPGTAYEEIAQTVMDIDKLLAVDYACGGTAQTKPASDPKTYWAGTSSVYIRTKIVEESKTILFKVFLTSGNNGSKLTYEEVLNELNKEN